MTTTPTPTSTRTPRGAREANWRMRWNIGAGWSDDLQLFDGSQCPTCFPERDPAPQPGEGGGEHWSREASVESLLNALNGEIGVLEEDAKAALSEMRTVKDELARRLRASEDHEPRGGGGDG